MKKTKTPTEADRIAELINAAGLSQRGAARELGINERTMRRYCAGDSPVPRVVFLALERLRDIRQGRESPAS